MSRTEQIHEIIQSRRNLAKHVNTVSQSLRSLDLLLNRLRNQKLQVADSLFSGESIPRIATVDFDSMHQRIDEERRAFDLLAKRLDRPKLNIGVIGRGRQGKSFLLQKLANLSSAVFPDGDADFCTGALSRVCHHPEKLEAEAYLHYYTEASFLEEVIAPYYKRLRLGDPPSTILSFSQNPPSLPIGLRDDADFKEYQALYSQFYNDYYLNLPRYENRLKQAQLPKIRKDDIKDYVTQQRDNHGNRTDFENLALREVEINCSFGDGDIGDIAFIDLPGSGDAKRGFLDLERLIKAVKEDVDFILFVCMPDMGNWREEEVELYKAARKAFGDFPIGDSSFMVLNHHRGRNNLTHCKRFRESFDFGQINVQECLIVDFADHDEVRNKLLIPVLNHLSSNIKGISQKAVEAHQSRVDAVRHDLIALLNDCSISSSNDLDDFRFVDLRNHLWREIKIGLEKKCEQFFKLREKKRRRLRETGK